MPRTKLRTPELRDEVLSCASVLLERDGPAGLQARAVAAEAGVSIAALYELFGDKAGLVRAVFFDGFARLERLLASEATTRDPRRDVLRLVEASRRFALEAPVRFEVMYSRPVAEFSPTAEEWAAGAAVYGLVVNRVRRWLAAEGSAADPVDAAQALVCAARGLIAAELSGVLGDSPDSVERRWSLTMATLLDGLANVRVD